MKNANPDSLPVAPRQWRTAAVSYSARGKEMNPERQQFLSLRMLPGRLTLEETAWFLGFHPHDIPILTRAKLLKPLGSPAPNSVKYFSAAEARNLVADRAWLDKATKALASHWKKKAIIVDHSRGVTGRVQKCRFVDTFVDSYALCSTNSPLCQALNLGAGGRTRTGTGF